jgi:hypothetical protein
MKKTLILACALAVAGVSTSAMAAGKAFVRGEVGTTDVKLVGTGASDSDTSFSLRGGYYFTANIAVEASATSLYDKDDAKVTAYGLGAVVKKNFGENNTGPFFSARAGVERLEGELAGFEDSSNKGYAGLGAGYDFSESFGLSLNYEVHEGEFFGTELNADTISLGGEYRF